MARLFGTDGVRGVANVGPLAAENVLALGRAIVQVLAPPQAARKPVIIIGRDTRWSSPMLEAALTAGVCAAGADVLTVGVLPTPGVAYLVRHLGALAGVVISASHNPYMDNGIKVFASTGMKLDDDVEVAVEAHLQATGTTSCTGTDIGCPQSYAAGVEQYSAFLQQTFRGTVPLDLAIGLDCAHGAASAVAPALFRRLCRQVHVWHASPDGININQDCGAVQPEFLQRQVVEAGLDVGFAFDGDADRLMAVDHTGRLLDGDDVLAICAQALWREAVAPRCVVSTVMANLGLDRAVQQMGGTVHRTPVGDKAVVDGMRQVGAWLGGEQSGHVVFLQHHTTGDGLLTAIQLLNAMAVQRQPLATLAQVSQKYPQYLLNLPIRERRDPLTLPSVQRAITAAEATLGQQGRVVVRLSGTEAKARVMVEGPAQALIEQLAQQIGQAITQEIGLG